MAGEARSGGVAGLWEGKLAGFVTPTHVGLPKLPGVGPGGYRQGRLEGGLDAATTAALVARASKLGTTPGTLVQCAWAIALSALRGSRDVVFATTVSGRPAELVGADRMVGLFINAVPTRIELDDAEPFAELVGRVHRALGEAVPHHYCPLAEIKARTAVGRDLFDHILVFENYEAREPAAPSGGLAITQLGIAEKTNYALTLQVYPGERLGLGLDFDRERVAKSELLVLLKRFERVLKRIASDAKLHVGALREIVPVVVAASFSAQPLVPHIDGWLRRAGHAVQCTLAPYDQVMQQLLDPKSELRAPGTRGMVLQRIDDLARSGPATTAGFNQALDDLAKGLAASDQPLWFGLFPPTYAYAQSAAERTALDAAQVRLGELLRALPHISVLDLGPVEQRYDVETVTDARADAAGHVPFSEPYLAALGASLARAVLTSLREPFKVIAVDCDNTLWMGVAAEDGATGVRIGPSERALHELLIRKVSEGFLVTLVSKNAPADVWAVFDTHPDMVLKREHIAAAELSWRPKSEGLRRLAAELDLGLRSFLFLDDNPVECGEVMQACPEVLTVRMPMQGSAALLEHLWALDGGKVTDEDRQRTALYRAEKDRVEARATSDSLDAYLVRLGLVLNLAPIGDRDLARAAQLTQRTNQFNLSTQRRSEAELKVLLARPETLGWCVRVRDRFGDYGLVGVVLGLAGTDSLHLDTLLLSCRVLGRGVEDAILVALGQKARAAGLGTLRGTLVPTERNAPVQDFVRRAGFTLGPAGTDGIPIVLSVDNIAAERHHCEIIYDTLPAAQVEAPSPVAVPEPRPGQPGRHRPARPACHRDLARRSRARLHAQRSHAARSSAPLLLRAADGDARYRAYGHPSHPRALRGPRPAHRPLRTLHQLELARIWHELLGADDLGLDDDFFALGGHSLNSVQLVSRIQRDLGLVLTLTDVFDHPTLGALAAHLQAAEHRALPPIPRQPLAADYPLSDAQRRLWALEHLQGEASSYLMAGAVVLEGRLEIPLLERAFAQVRRAPRGVTHRDCRDRRGAAAAGAAGCRIPPAARHCARPGHRRECRRRGRP